MNVLAALLVIIGYSMNDTIVIFDRIRETVATPRHGRARERGERGDERRPSSRTVLTSGLTQLVVVAILLVGGPVLRGFALALFIGILVGTYSSIYIASAVLIWLARRYGHPVPGKAAKAASARSAPRPGPAGESDAGSAARAGPSLRRTSRPRPRAAAAPARTSSRPGAPAASRSRRVLHGDRAVDHRALGDGEARGDQVALDAAGLAHLDALARDHVARDLAHHGDLLGGDFALDVAVRPDRQVEIPQRDAPLDAPLEDRVLVSDHIALDADRLADVRHLITPRVAAFRRRRAGRDRLRTDHSTRLDTALQPLTLTFVLPQRHDYPEPVSAVCALTLRRESRLVP